MTEISTNDMSSIIWIKNETLPPQGQVEWSKEELEHLALLAQADLVFLIAQLFAPPSAEMQRLLEIEIPDIEKLLDKSMLPASFAERYQEIREQAQSLNLETWAAEYKHLFEGNACPINESGFIQRDKSVILAEIAEFYQAFGFEREKADHLTSELEFVAMLLVKLAQMKETKRTTHEALSSFIFHHLGKWLDTFCERLIETSTLPIYQEMAQLLLSAWSEIQTSNQLSTPEAMALS